MEYLKRVGMLDAQLRTFLVSLKSFRSMMTEIHVRVIDDVVTECFAWYQSLKALLPELISAR